MRIIGSFLFLLTLLNLSLAQERADGRGTNFLESSLEGWTAGANLEASFKDGEMNLVSKHQTSLLVTESTQDNFTWNAEVYLSPMMKGKILFRHVGGDGPNIDMEGYAVSLNHDAEQQNPTGSIINVARGLWLPSFDTARWFHFEIHASGDHLRVLIDSVLVSQTHHRRSMTGHLGFAVEEGFPLRVRNIKVMPLPKPSAQIDIRDYFDAHPATPFVTIFDGKTMAGWSTSGDGSWDISNEVLHGYSGEKGGHLISDKAYQNFHLKIDFKIIKGDNSGVFIRRNPNDADVTLQNSIECNIYDFNGLSHAYSTGSFVTYARAWNSITDYESWNTAEIFAWGNQVAMYINGVKAAHADLPQFNRAGNICLQAGIKVFSPDKGPSDIYFRNIRIKSLD